MHHFFKLHIKPYLVFFSHHSEPRYIIMALIVIALSLLFIERRRKEKSEETERFQAIAGEDVMTTQLDLAKAYIEMGQKDLAGPILKNIKRKGTNTLKTEAERLIKTL